jgi:hypothetical protein
MNFLDKFNSDDVFFRGLIIGMLKSLNEKITFYQTTSSGKIQEVYIPFFYSLAGDESFLQDFYLNYGDCDGNPLFAEGNYDVVPRGILEYQSSRITTSSSTNKYVRGTYEKEIVQESGGSEIKAYSAYLTPIPIDATFTLKIKVDTATDALKIQARTIEVLFKNFIYYFEYNGFRVPVQASLSDQVPDKTPNTFNFSYGSTRGEGITLSINVNAETYLPQLDLTSERFRGNLMQAGIKLKTDIGIVPEDNSSILKSVLNASKNTIK